MASPTPPAKLKNPCSVVNNNTLYVYTADAFQALPLQQGGEWSQLAMGVSVSGAACVKAGPEDDPSLYIVGGVTNAMSGSVSAYPGLQRYSFSNHTWVAITPSTAVTQNRRNHASAYLNSSSSILVYAGSQEPNDVQPSSQTFVISTVPPYTVQAFSSIAPPGLRPQLLTWNDRHTLMVGGSPKNKALFTFNAETGWHDLGIALQNRLPDLSEAASAIMHFDDNSKVLQTYDASVSPNTITDTVLVSSAPRTSVTPPSFGERPAERGKISLSLSNWPAYNSSLAPRATRSNFSLAQDSTGLTVICGGNDQDPVVLFDNIHNSWIDANMFFIAQSTSAALPSTVVASFASASSRASATSMTSSSTSSLGGSRERTLAILGATLGAFFGTIVMVLLLLFVLRWRSRRAEKFNKKSYIKINKSQLSFADRGAAFMSEAGGFLGQHYNHANGSNSSLAIIGDRSGSCHKKGVPAQRSDATAVVLNSKTGSPVVEMHNVDGGNSDRVLRWKVAVYEKLQGSALREAESEIPSIAHADGSLNGCCRSSVTESSGHRMQRLKAAARLDFTDRQLSDRGLVVQRTAQQSSTSRVKGSVPKEEEKGLQLTKAHINGRRPPELSRASSSGSTVSSLYYRDPDCTSPDVSGGQATELTEWSPVGIDTRNGSRSVTSSVYTESLRGSELVARVQGDYPFSAARFYPVRLNVKKPETAVAPSRHGLRLDADVQQNPNASWLDLGTLEGRRRKSLASGAAPFLL